jgi:hypothetical protein
MNHIELLENLEACDEVVEWANGYESLEQAWNECKRSDWMLWLDREMDLFTDKERRLMACQFVRKTPIGDGKTVWDLLTDERSRNAVIVAERFANGEATEEELATARDAAMDAARAAASAAWADVRDAASAAARDAASAAASAARADASQTARAAARTAYYWAAQSDIIRSYGNPFNENNKKGQ